MAESDLKFTEKGLKILHTIAEKMEAMMAAGGVIAVSAPGVGTIIGAALFVMALVELMTDDDADVIKALKQLQKQIDEIKFAVTVLDERLDVTIMEEALENNRQTLRDLLDYLDDFRILETELLDRADDVDTSVRVANEVGVILDKFLRNDFEIWRWTDVVEKEYFDPTTGQTRREPASAQLCFKNIPTLPVYLTGLLIWIAAREKAVVAGQRHRLSDDQARLERHRAATSVRTDFNKYDPDENGMPTSIAEHIKWRIRAFVVASTRYPHNRVCEFYFLVGSMMTGRSQPGTQFELLMPPDADTCFINPYLLGPPEAEIELETRAGLDTLHALTEVLAHLAGGGFLRQQFTGTFSNEEAFPSATLYVVDQNADLQWYRNDAASARGGSPRWVGPKKVNSGWGGFTHVFNSGGAALYGIAPSGALQWFGHDGHLDGTPQWRGPHPVADSWGSFTHVVSGGEYIVYGIHADGRVMWYRHDGAPTGGAGPSWTGPNEVATGWPAYDTVFAGGDGVIYGIRPDGVLERRKHTGYLQGSKDWEPPREIGTGWQNIHAVVGGPDGVIYAFTHDGRILWYRFAKRRPPAPTPLTPEDNGIPGLEVGPRVTQPDPIPGLEVGPRVTQPPPEPGVTVGPLVTDREVWEGPVEIKRNFPAFRSVCALTNTPPNGIA